MDTEALLAKLRAAGLPDRCREFGADYGQWFRAARAVETLMVDRGLPPDAVEFTTPITVNRTIGVEVLNVRVTATDGRSWVVPAAGREINVHHIAKVPTIDGQEVAVEEPPDSWRDRPPLL